MKADRGIIVCLSNHYVQGKDWTFMLNLSKSFKSTWGCRHHLVVLSNPTQSPFTCLSVHITLVFCCRRSQSPSWHSLINFVWSFQLSAPKDRVQPSEREALPQRGHTEDLQPSRGIHSRTWRERQICVWRWGSQDQCVSGCGSQCRPPGPIRKFTRVVRMETWELWRADYPYEFFLKLLFNRFLLD